MTHRSLLLAVAASLAMLLPAAAADNYPVKDANGSTITIRSKDVGGGAQSPVFVPGDATGNPVFSTSNPGYIVFPSGAVLPLPTGAATAANQATANTSLSSIDTKTPALVGGKVPVDTGNAPATQTTTGALEPPTAGSGKITKTSVAVTANTSTQLVAANASRIYWILQCGTGAVAVDETGATLASAALGAGTVWVASGKTDPYFPPVATRTAITAYTASAQTCVVTEYLR